MGGSIQDNELVSAKTVCPALNCWFETGTYKGESSRKAAQHFSLIYTWDICEINPRISRHMLLSLVGPDRYLTKTLRLMKKVDRGGINMRKIPPFAGWALPRIVLESIL